jgi:hypothetical protein
MISCADDVSLLRVIVIKSTLVELYRCARDYASIIPRENALFAIRSWCLPLSGV